MKKNDFVLVFTAVLLTIGLSACRKKTETVKVQFIHAANNVGYLDFYLQGSNREQLIGTGAGSNPHTADIEPGNPLVVEIKNPGTGVVLATAKYTDWKPNAHCTFVLYGDNNYVQHTLFSDSVAWPAAGRFKVRYSHFGMDAPALDVFYNNDTIAFNKVYFGTDSTNAIGDFVDLPAGTYTVRVKDHATGQTYIIQPNLGIQDNRILEIFSTGLVNDSLSAFFRLGGIAR